MKNKVTENPLKNRENEKLQGTLLTITGLMVMIYMVSNILSVKVIEIRGISLFDAGTITFPIAYMLGDVLTEIWGFKMARRIIWITFLCNVLVLFFTTIGVFLPAPDYMQETDEAFQQIFTYVPRIIVASLVGFVSGELINAWALIEIRKKTGMKWLWMRTIGSSILGYFFDTVLFMILAFAGTVPVRELLSMILIQYIFKLGIEVLFSTPMAYGMIGWLRRQLNTKME